MLSAADLLVLLLCCRWQLTKAQAEGRGTPEHRELLAKKFEARLSKVGCCGDGLKPLGDCSQDTPPVAGGLVACGSNPLPLHMQAVA